MCRELRVVLLMCLLLEAATLLLNLSVCQEHDTDKPYHGGINVFVYDRFSVSEICSEVIKFVS